MVPRRFGECATCEVNENKDLRNVIKLLLLLLYQLISHAIQVFLIRRFELTSQSCVNIKILEVSIWVLELARCIRTKKTYKSYFT